MADSVLDSTPAQFAEMFRKDPMALVCVLREFWKDVEKTVRIEDYQRGAMVDFYFDDEDCRYRFSALEGRLSRIKDGMDTAARYCMAIGRLGKSHAQSITQQIRILAELPSPGGNHVSTALWFPDTIDLIEFELKQLQTAQSGIVGAVRSTGVVTTTGNVGKTKRRGRSAKATRKPAEGTETWKNWILAHWCFRRNRSQSKMDVIEALTGVRAKHQTIYDHLDDKKWLPADDSDFAKAKAKYGDLDLLPYSP